MSQKICGMTFDEYVKFHCDFVGLTRRISDGEATDADIIPFLKGYGLEVVRDKDDPDEIDSEYYMGAGLKPWEDVINKDPDLQGKKVMALLQWQNREMHGAAEESADVEIEGVSLENYARACASFHLGKKKPEEIYAECGLRDEAHWTAVNQGYQAAMAADATGRLNVHYSEFFMKYQPEHAAAVHQIMSNAMAQNTADLEARDRRNEEVKRTVQKMAAKETPEAIAAYVKEKITDADDEDELDSYLSDAADRLAEKKKWDDLKRVLEARFLILQPGGDRDDWVKDEMDSAGAFDEDDD